MSFKKFVVPVLLFAVVAAGAFTAYQVSDLGQADAAREQVNVSNESISQQTGIWQLTDNATNTYTTGFQDEVSVYNNTGDELVRGTDYEWNASDGSILFYSTANTTDGASATISYTYGQNTQAVQEVSGPLSGITEGIGLSPILAGGIALVIFLIAVGGFMAKRFADSGPSTNR